MANESADNFTLEGAESMDMLSVSGAADALGTVTFTISATTMATMGSTSTGC